jgi:surface antigen
VVVLTVVLTLFLHSGCSSMSNTDKGVLTGGALGATAGGLIGGSHGKAAPGAFLGGALGAVAGGLTGNAIDKSEQRAEARAVAAASATAPAAQPALSLQDVVELTRSGSSDDVIINQVRLSGAVYQLRTEDLLYLQNNGVREPVIRELQATGYRQPRRVYTAVPVAQPVYVYPPPPPPVGVGFGFSYTGGRRRCW